ncbi:calcium-transporting ATPase 7, plasma membrane-type-like [Phoenix dactylifera]|uniref:Calcium-transporting ATPase n=1 Tax=Phoenix dactylifera TaxID=42345 RepID=A0A8B7CWR2_PHODC|nr:calcium-transporting ATPase 7, plasma membrane-type-like [Phoenix dactylifera]
MDFAACFLAPGRRITLPHKRWRVAMTVIYSCRTICTLAKKKLSAVLRSPSYVLLDIDGADHQSETPVFDVDAEVLSTVVKEKKLDDLHRLGGVSMLAGRLACHAEAGIAGGIGDLRRRQEVFGSNTYPKPKPKGFFWFVYEALNDFFLLILIACAVVSLGFGIKEHGIKDGWYDGASIFLAIFLVAVVSSISNFRQMKRFDKLAGECSNIHANVIRDGRRQDVSIFDIVVGDIVFLKIGDQVPADGLFLEGHSLQVDESSMTGECHPIDVDAQKNPFLTSGVKVVDGYARMLVTAVGMDTTWGEMMSTITRETTEPTPLQERLQKLTSSIGKIGIAVAVLVFAVLMIRYFTGSTTDENGRPKFDRRKVTADGVISAIVEIFQQAVTIIVVAIPEGLPLAVTLTLAFSMKRMMKDHALVRRLSACETMGSVTTICTDKTGTLTLNQMMVTTFWVGEERVERGGAASIDGRILRFIHQGVGLNTTGSVYRPNSVSEPEITGSPTEKALLSWALELGMDVEELKRSCDIVHVEAFNSEKKRSGVLVKENGRAATIAHWKGAAEMILARCSNYIETNGMIREMDAEKRRMFDLIIKDMAACSLRCIAFACKESEAEDVRKLDDERLTLLGLVGLKDPCRPKARSAIQACRSAGAAVKMITGDNVFTARAIAAECGILRDDDLDGLVIEGEEFRNYSIEKRLEMVDRIRVMARSSPFDKLLMVQSLKQKGHVVAVTGDGTNDAPALKEADVGLSMGIQGTEVAKESSDIIIMDDNFDTVVTVMRWGRCVYTNIQKFLQFQLTVNIAALVINFVSAVASGEVPLTTVQLLWVNLIMDTMGALALATDRPTKELMQKPPVGRTEPLISNIMWRNITAQALFQIAVLLVFQFAGKSIFGASEKINNTMIFNTFVLCQVFNEFNARKLEKKNVFEGIHRNQLFLGIIAVTLILQVMMVELLKRFADTERLDWGQWGICAGIAAISWPIAWIVKCIHVSTTPVSDLLALCKVF